MGVTFFKVLYVSVCSLRPPWTVTHLVPLSLGFSRQGYWSQLPFPAPGDRPDPGMKPSFLAFLALAADSLLLPPSESPVGLGKEFNIQMHWRGTEQF